MQDNTENPIKIILDFNDIKLACTRDPLIILCIFTLCLHVHANIRQERLCPHSLQACVPSWDPCNERQISKKKEAYRFI